MIYLANWDRLFPTGLQTRLDEENDKCHVPGPVTGPADTKLESSKLKSSTYPLSKRGASEFCEVECELAQPNSVTRSIP